MNISTQIIRFNSASHTMSIHLSRPFWLDETTVEFIRDGWFVSGQIEIFDSMPKAMAYGLSVIKDKVDEDLALIDVEVSSEMLTGEDILALIGEAGFQAAAVSFI